MISKVRNAIRISGIVSAGVAAVLSPIPLADEIMMLPILTALTLRIGSAHELPLGEIPWKPVGVAAAKALGARAVGNLAVAGFPGVALIANAVSAYALSGYVGREADRLCLRRKAELSPIAHASAASPAVPA